MTEKEKKFYSYDSQGPTDFDEIGFHSDTIEDILKLIDICQKSNEEGLPITSEKLDELKHYTLKLQRYVNPFKYHSIIWWL